MKPDSSAKRSVPEVDIESPEAYLNRELSWLGFASRVIALVENPDLPLLERVKFISIVSSNLDEFFMKRIGGLKQQVGAGVVELTVDGRTPQQQIDEAHLMVEEIEGREERIDEFVARRSKGYEGVAPYKRAANIKRARSEFLQERHEALVSRMSKDLRRWFPELKYMGAPTVHALELVTSFEAWDRLRVDQRLGKQRAAEAVKRVMSALLRARG